MNAEMERIPIQKSIVNNKILTSITVSAWTALTVPTSILKNKQMMYIRPMKYY